MDFAWTIVALVVVLAIAWRFLGSYMAAVFEGRVRWLVWSSARSTGSSASIPTPSNRGSATASR